MFTVSRNVVTTFVTKSLGGPTQFAEAHGDKRVGILYIFIWINSESASLQQFLCGGNILRRRLL